MYYIALYNKAIYQSITCYMNRVAKFIIKRYYLFYSRNNYIFSSSKSSCLASSSLGFISNAFLKSEMALSCSPCSL